MNINYSVQKEIGNMWKSMGLMALFLCVFTLFDGRAQESNTSQGNGVFMGVFYGLQFPGGDLADRFDHNFSVGANFEIIKDKKWIYGIEGQFLFGSDVNENILGEIVNDDGRLINAASSIAEIEAKERGLHFFAKVGRIYDFWGESHISGLKITVGAGYLQHKIRLKDRQNALPFFEDNYVKGFDRLTQGFALNQFIGYQYLDGRGGLNFFGGFEFIEAITKNQRGLNYNTKMREEGSRFDMLIGLKVGVQITFRRFQAADDIWY